jgi:hypothetical protein
MAQMAKHSRKIENKSNKNTCMNQAIIVANVWSTDMENSVITSCTFSRSGVYELRIRRMTDGVLGKEDEKIISSKIWRSVNAFIH